MQNSKFKIDSPLRGIVLDVDGTLIASNDAHAQAFIEAARRVGLDVPPYEEVRRLIGKGGDKLIPEVWGIPSEEGKGKELSSVKGEIFRDRYLPNLQATPGARALLEQFRDDGLKLVVATSAKEEDLKHLLKRAGIEDLIEGGTTASDVEDSKPDPDVMHSAVNKAGLEPTEMLMLGDTPYDVEAASRAGVRTVAVRCGGWSDDDLSGAIAIYDDPADLLSRYSESPFGSAG
ncbi:MAG TPA: HAD family hydrolase [Longimicrobiaceae bacterium]|nr:HAD family hydrolase [Longimicrobiaceae bacterium]